MSCFIYVYIYDALYIFSSLDIYIQVPQVLLTLPYSFSQLRMMSGILLQVFYGLLGSWTTCLIRSIYVEYRNRKEREKADFKNHVMQVVYYQDFFNVLN